MSLMNPKLKMGTKIKRTVPLINQVLAIGGGEGTFIDAIVQLPERSLETETSHVFLKPDSCKDKVSWL